MRITRVNLRFYLAVHLLIGALCLFFLAKEGIPSLPEPWVLGAGGGILALLYLVFISTWALRQCLRNNYSLWLAPLSGGLAGMVLGVALEFLFLQGSAQEGLAVNSCLAAGTLVAFALFSRRFVKAQMDSRGQSGRLRSWV
ncbi:MAG: hypothetical protein ACYTFG_16695 [Planctomycetota bacterium]